MKVATRTIATLGACWLMLVGSTTDPAGAERRRFVELESGVLREINRARTDPQGYAEMLREYRTGFEGRLVRRSGDPVGVLTREGAAAVDEAIAALEAQVPLPALAPGDLLGAAAHGHAVDRGRDGLTGHRSRDGAGPGERVRRLGGGVYVSESIAYGHRDPAAVVRALIVDDGVPGRGHRRQLFDPQYRYAGVGCSTHLRYAHVCVIDLSRSVDGSPVFEGVFPASRAGS